MSISEKKIHILLVEDDEDDYLLLRKLLQKVKYASYTLDWERTFEDGLNAVKEAKHDIYLVDYRLGEFTGLELILKSQKAGCDRPIILLTGLGDEELGIKALRLGAEDYLIKSDITTAILERSIRYALERQENNQRKQALIAEQAARKSLESQKNELEILLEKIKKSEQEIIERERHYSSIIETLAEGLLIHNPEGRVIAQNDSALRILGVTVSQLNGISPMDPLFSIIHEDGTPFTRADNPVLLVAKTGKPHLNTVMCIRRPNHHDVWIINNSVPLYKPGESKHYCIVSTFVDITKRKLLEQQKDQFIGTASHELKTPVTSLKLFAELLHRHSSQKGDETTREYSEIIMGQSNRLVSLLNDLLDVSRIQAGKLELRYSAFNIDDLIKEIIHIFKHTKKSKHDIVYKGMVNKHIYADKDRVSQVLTNLVSNALKYSPNADRIEIEVKENNNKAEIIVRDFGFGIAEEDQPKLFERFYRTPNVHQKNIAGFGLGLHISREIIRKHGEDIRVHSKAGEGATFAFYLPFHKSTE